MIDVFKETTMTIVYVLKNVWYNNKKYYFYLFHMFKKTAETSVYVQENY